MAVYVAQRGIDNLKNMASAIHYTRNCGYLRQRKSSQYPQEYNLSKRRIKGDLLVHKNKNEPT